MRDARDRQPARHPGQHDHAGDDGRRSQHDADLEGGRGDFVVVIFCRRIVALVLSLLGALGELFRSFAGFRLRAVARRGLVPVVDLLLQRRLGGIVPDRAQAELGMLGGGLHHGAADALGLEERPQVRGFDVLADGFGLRALAQRFRQRQEQRDDSDQQRDLLVGAGSVLGVFRMLHAFVGAHVFLLLAVTGHTIERTNTAQDALRGSTNDMTACMSARGDAPSCRLPAAARCRCRCRSAWSRARRGRAIPGSRAGRRRG